jgi:hypothetical protein
MLMDVARGVFSVAIMFGALVILLTMLNRRARRASQLRRTVLDQLALPEWRGRVGVNIRYAGFRRRRAVSVDLLAGTPGEVWNVFTRLASRLPPSVHLVVHGVTEAGCTRPFALKTTTGRLPSHTLRASLGNDGDGSGVSRMTAPAPRRDSSARRCRIAACLGACTPRSDMLSRGDV